MMTVTTGYRPDRARRLAASGPRRRAQRSERAPAIIGLDPLDPAIVRRHCLPDALDYGTPIAVNANIGVTVAAASRFLASAGGLLENFEEPVPGLADMGILARASGLPISTHCADVETMGHYPGISGIVSTLDAARGIAAIVGFVHACTRSGRRLWIRSHAEASGGWAAIVHLDAALPELERPAQSLIDPIDDDLMLGEPWLVRAGGVIPPDRPGLGVEPDWPAIRRCHELYLWLGEHHAFKPPLPRPARRVPSGIVRRYDELCCPEVNNILY